MPNLSNREGRRRRSSRAQLLLLLTAVVASAGCNGSSNPAAEGAPTNGPVQFPDAQVRQLAGMRAIEGEQVVFGANSVVNKGKVSAVLNDARLLGGTSDDGADVREVRVIDLGEAPGTGDLLGAGKWPDRSWKRWWSTAQPIAGGVELPAGHAAELVFILDIKQTGEWVWPQTALDYEVGDDPYTAITNFGFQVCPPSPAECSQLSGSDSS